VRAAGYRVLPIPGCSSAVTALSAAGDARTSGFTFVGFLPAKGSERKAALQAVAAQPQAQVLFEAPHRVQTLAAELAQAVPQRLLSCCRELTKQFESIHTLPAADFPAWLAEDTQRLRGEFVLVLHAAPAEPAAEEADALPAEAERALRTLLAELPLKQAVSLAATLSGAPRNALYQRALALKAEG
jgi:16S rRNA (cytidine1402-2'-O)-methyltransferase